MALTESLSYVFLVGVGTIFLTSLAARVRKRQHPPDIWCEVDTVGVKAGSFLSLSAAVATSIILTRRRMSEGYRRYCKVLNKPFALPTTWMSSGKVLVMPPSAIPSLVRPDRLSESEWTNRKGMVETIELPYIISDPEIYENLLQFDVVRRKMGQKDVGRLAGATGNEISLAFRDIWGTDCGWKTVTGWDMCGRVISRASQRILIGMPLSRDKTLLEISRQYATSLLVGGAIMNCFPPFLRRFAGPLIALRAKYYQARLVKMLTPMVEDRIHIWKAGKADVPDDFLQWMIPILAKEGNEQIDASRIALRLVSMLIPLIYAMCYVFSHSVFDINGSKDRTDVLTALEEECSRVVAQHGGLDSPEALNDLHRIDSALRESMRVSDVAVTNVFRDVTAGVLDIGSNLCVGPGVRMVLPTQDIHLDPDNYAEPRTFDAFRFSRPFEQGRAHGQRETMTKETLTFLPWGYGRHTCPGRWFVSQTVKQALAYLILNYDVELVGKPVKRRALLNTMVPPIEAKFRFRQKGDDISI